ncbi:MAG: hypothetical protein NTY81_00340 [Candidatus Staskawiczbacteria bacterium]|nr:hypothetical protein [Candidatus Staskawiczbacteria bacterium]
MELDKNKIDEFIKKVQSSKDHEMDLSSDEDLSIAIMNLVSIEEHFFFTGAKLDKPEYFDLLNTAREMRKDLLKKIIKEYEGEVWCISKHLLAASMRLMEVGTKALGRGKKEEAEDLFRKAYELYSLFWGINLKLVNVGEVKKIGDDQIGKDDKQPSSAKASAGKEKGVLGKLGDVVQYVINCCKE